MLLTYGLLTTPPPKSLNKSVLQDLDTIDDQLTRSLEATEKAINQIEEQPDNTTVYINYTALAFSFLSCLIHVILINVFSQSAKQ